MQGAVAEAVPRFGRLDCIFNNAGFGGVSGPIEAIDIGGLRSDDGRAAARRLLGMKHAAPGHEAAGRRQHHQHRQRGRAARRASGPHVYSAAKAAVIHLTSSVAMELGETTSA